ncbi:cellulose-binding protein [Aphanothece hegewaldii CCALA 016]|uniref:Cellulose-binding protein n=1 Tax=Aphanothece hegewaldii CCALA 016 TaxID=2107694 RepID=A0A2T1M1W6_9CHRO|nr:cadherin-like domain-containing protein [Aphanothece hegewaldii]PSF38702.1 cellulose-binding protein [Aphanothece hegewaldii CCALA 016]
MSLETNGNLLFDDETLLTSYGTNENQILLTNFLNNNKMIALAGNSWVKFKIPTYEITQNTILSFSFKSTSVGDIHAIGVDNDNMISPNQIFQISGTQDYGVLDNNNYLNSTPGTWKNYKISLNQYLTGEIKYLTFINDQNDNQTGNSYFANITLSERLAPKTDTFNTLEDNFISIATNQLISNDIGTSLNITGVGNAINGTVSLNNNNVVFTPTGNFYGNGSFRYTVSDRNGKTSAAAVNIKVKSVNDVPITVNDNFATNKNNSLAIPINQLLSNDSDPDGDILSLIGVNQAVNGSVQLSGTNVLFTPNPNFSGAANFNYTVSDGKGGTSTTQVTVTVNSLSSGDTTSGKLGTNLAGLADYSAQLPFIDGFRTSRSWIPQKWGVWDTGESSLLNLDADGYVKSLPSANSSTYTFVGTILFRDLQGKYPGGKYIVLYDGEGTINYNFDAVKDVTASRPGRDVINVTPSEGGIYISITATDPNQTGNYIRNIRVVPEAALTTYAQQIFNPTFVEKSDPFGAVRFMDWMGTNNSTQSQWNDRPTLTDASWATTGTPVEVMVKLANSLDIDPWFCMPHLATNEYVTNFAQYVKDNLEPGRKVYVEYSNEAWNWQFQQTHWVYQQSLAAGLEFYMDLYSKRTTEITRIWDGVWGTDKERVIGVMGSQAANVWLGQRELSYVWDTTGPKSHEYYGIDAIAIAPYFGGYLGDPNTANEIASWTQNPDGGLSKLFDELTQGGVISSSPQGGALQESYSWMANYASLAQQQGLELLAYEGGQHLVGYWGAENNQALTNLFIAANRDPRMGDIYKQYLNKWYELGGGTFLNFSDIGLPTKWGSWGTLEYASQNSSPKYNALMDVIQSLSTSSQ